MPETRSQAAESKRDEDAEVYKLSEIFSIIPEFDGDQIFLNTFLYACDCANSMANIEQKVLLSIHIKNKLRGKAAQLINSRNPLSYNEIKSLLNLHFGDSRDLSSLIQDLQRMKQLPNESPLNFVSRLQTLNAKMIANINKSLELSNEQKLAQCSLIDTMSLNTLLTGLEPRLGQIIRSGNPRDILQAQSRIKRELQLSYFESNKNNPIRSTIHKQPQPSRNPIPTSIKCNFCGRLGHLSSQCRFRQTPQASYPQNNSNPSQAQPSAHNQPSTSYQPRPNYFQNQQRPVVNQNQPFRSSVIQKNPNQPRNHHVNYDQEYYDQPIYYDDYYYDENTDYIPQEEDYFEETENYENFLTLPHQNDPPTEIQTLNLNQKNPNLDIILEHNYP